MKKLNKLHINTEKLLKPEALMTLRGGYEGGTMGLKCYYDYSYIGCFYTICGINWTEGIELCKAWFGPNIDDCSGGCNENCPE